MKKYFLMALCLGAMLASCSSDNQVDSPANPGHIGFSAFTAKNSRGETNTANLTSFQVYGYNWTTDQTTPVLNPGTLVFDNVTVTKGNGGDWSYNPLVYWMKESTYKFSALGIGKESGALQSVPGLQGLGKESYGTFDYSADGETDVVYAVADRVVTTIPKGPDPVNLTFNHALCRVKFTFTDASPELYKVEVSDLKLDGTPASGTFNLAATQPGSWTGTSGALQQGYVMNPGNLTTGYHYLIPAQATFPTETVWPKAKEEGKTLFPTFTVTVYQNTGTADDPNWAPQAQFEHKLGHNQIAVALVTGHSYNITASLRFYKPGGDDPSPGPGPNVDPDNDLYPIIFNVTEVNNFNDPDENLPMN